MVEQNQQSIFNRETNSLQEFIQILQSLKASFIKDKRLYISIIGIVAFLFIVKALLTKETYTAKISFIIGEDKPVGMMNSILGQIGLSSGTNTSTSMRVLEFAKSNTILTDALFTKVNLNGQSDYLINHLNASSTPSLFSFNKTKPPVYTHDSIATFSHEERLALNILLLGFRDQVGTNLDKATAILSIQAKTHHEALSYQIVQSMYASLNTFYYNNAVEKYQTTYNIIKHKVDSIEHLLNRKDMTAAKLKDQFRNTWLNEAEVPKTQVDRDIRVLSVIYTEALKNLELAEFALLNSKPLIQAIDMPMLPLLPEKPSLIKQGLLGFIIGSLFAAFVLIIRQLLKPIQ